MEMENVTLRVPVHLVNQILTALQVQAHSVVTELQRQAQAQLQEMQAQLQEIAPAPGAPTVDEHDDGELTK